MIMLDLLESEIDTLYGMEGVEWYLYTPQIQHHSVLCHATSRLENNKPLGKRISHIQETLSRPVSEKTFQSIH